MQHARRLLEQLGVKGAVGEGGDHPALAWRRSGLMAITGPRLVLPAALTAAADGALLALKAIAPDADLPVSGAALLGERARILGLRAGGMFSANGSCRLLEARDGWLALNLPRPDDWDLLHALFGNPASGWDAVVAMASTEIRADLAERGRELGLAIAPDEAVPPPSAPFTVAHFGEGRVADGTPLVVDLSALWAGPLAGSLLRAAGARVIKVESLNRPDGARSGSSEFFDLLNGGKASIALDFSDHEDLRQLRGLIAAADIVIESTRPRALAHLGIDAEAFARTGGTWVSITAHGRDGAGADWIGFGDDAAVAGGLVSAMHAGWGKRLFAGDAIGDPLTGITAALVAWASWRSGGGRLVSLALAGVTAHALALYRPEADELRLWQDTAANDCLPLYALRSTHAVARALGQDNALLAELVPNLAV